MTVLRVSYKSGVRFDQGYYLSKHMPLAGPVMDRLGVKSVEIMKVMAMADGSKPVYQLIFSAYFESLEILQSAMKNPQMGPVMADIQNYYDGMPDIFIGEVIALPA